MLQTTNGESRRRKPKWDENPLASRPCRFESGLGYQLYVDRPWGRIAARVCYPQSAGTRLVSLRRGYDVPVRVRVFALRRVGRRYTHHDQECIVGELHLLSIMRGSAFSFTRISPSFSSVPDVRWKWIARRTACSGTR